MRTRATTTAATVCAALVMTACGGPADSDPGPGATAGSTGPATRFTGGEEARSGGVAVKIGRVWDADGIAMEGGTERAGGKGKIVALETVVRNDTKAGMGLTCSPPFTSTLVDDRGRRYEPLAGLYGVPGNPGCDDRLRPGRKDEMLFVYRVPESAEIAAWEFAESGRKPSFVDLSGMSVL